MKAVVIGGGVVGLCCAVSLVERDIEVTVLDGGAVGAGASAGNAGWVVPGLAAPLGAPGTIRTGIRSALDPDGALVIRPTLDVASMRWLLQFRRSCTAARYSSGVGALAVLTRRTFDVLDGYRSAGVEFEEHRTGLLSIARASSGLDWLAALHEAISSLGVPTVLERLSPDEARRLEPALGPTIGVAMHSRLDRHVDPSSLTSGLASHLRRRGGLIAERCPVEGVRRSRDGWSVTAGEIDHACDAVVLATGAAANELLRPLGVRLPLVGAKGYSVTTHGQGLTPRHAVYLSESKLGLSPLAGGLRIAGFFELPARKPEPNPRRIAQLLDEAAGYLADWRPGPIVQTGWAGLRPATPDSLPFVGPIGGAHGLIVATGHGMLGVTLAPATGEAVAELVITGSVPTELAPFRIGRRL
jgi:D-amino-acid dehydrogenase